MKETPIIETERLVLRGHRRDDLERLHELWSHPVVYRHISGEPSSPERSWGRLLQYIGMWQAIGYGFWAMEEKATGRYIGDAGFADFNRVMEPAFGEVPEMGWVVSPEVHGKGYAVEALTKMLEWGKANLAARSARCIISPDNSASIKLARRCGFEPIAETNYLGEPVQLFERPLEGVPLNRR
ncbi:GNAT family N-acetyltransferase [Phyllobacterium sp. 21LDTY02-6]|jgi:RimJ/RimL family protein N-acetyltransferase|uniref:GNAT family N-acetyltransferase n=1 Tax=Phyllobacterium sp. 21LDTY02-6 TaxID=2944903 RepID=UPI00202034E7|nr:GNAT family N-acetyltransferase [Phyllobacterium sp. 21LDTY02-6]MCO4317085.1 GNAT family N-acetyltransferase [Phyllobacterium sp. 21LDTY02-6]